MYTYTLCVHNLIIPLYVLFEVTYIYPIIWLPSKQIIFILVSLICHTQDVHVLVCLTHADILYSEVKKDLQQLDSIESLTHRIKQELAVSNYSSNDSIIIKVKT